MAALVEFLLCSALTSGARNIIPANIILYKTPTNDTHSRIHNGTNTTSQSHRMNLSSRKARNTNKLDGDLKIGYLGVISPLCLTFAQLIFMSFHNRRSNKWWFGIRKSFCHFLLDICPCFQEYCNVSYNVLSQDEESNRRGENVTDAETSSSSSQSRKLKSIIITSKLNKPVVPIVSVEVPD